ncbi:MAG TPA: membrane-bound lytic murein transglycosylase MltF, partial [Pantoea sp.]|nr:membrane-bound lytic murein transglycosylase MltF [Pantoea sp.]
MKRLKLNYLLIGLVTLLLAMALWPSIPWYGNGQDAISQIKSRGVLRISTINSPLTYYTINKAPAGMDYELAKRFADYLGVKLKVTVRPNLSDLFDDLDDGKADLLAAGLIYNDERLARYKTGPSYYSVSQQLVYRVDKPRPKNLGDLKGELRVASGSAYLSSLKTARDKQYPDLNWVISTDQGPKALLEAVADGKLDYTIGDSVTIALLQRIHPQLAVAFDVTDEEPVTWYVPHNDDSSLNAAMLDFFNSMGEEGVMARLEEKYLGHVGTFDYVDTRTFLRAIDVTLPEIKPLFEKYAASIDWRLLAAISYQESHWNP